MSEAEQVRNAVWDEMDRRAGRIHPKLASSAHRARQYTRLLADPSLELELVMASEINRDEEIQFQVDTLLREGIPHASEVTP